MGRCKVWETVQNFGIIVEQLTCHYCLRDQGIEKSRQISINSAAAAHYACVQSYLKTRLVERKTNALSHAVTYQLDVLTVFWPLAYHESDFSNMTTKPHSHSLAHEDPQYVKLMHIFLSFLSSHFPLFLCPRINWAFLLFPLLFSAFLLSPSFSTTSLPFLAMPLSACWLVGSWCV